MLKRRAPSVVAAGDELVAFVVGQCQKHAHAVPLCEGFRVVCADFFPAAFFDRFGIRLRAFPAHFPLCKVGCPSAPPRHVSVPTEFVLALPGVAPQQHATQRHILWLKPVTPGGNEVEKIGRAVELGKARLSKNGMDEAPNRPRLVVARAMHIAFRAVDFVIAIFGRARFGHAVPRFAENGDPRIIDKVGDDDKPVFLQVGQPLWRGPRRREFGLGVCKGHSAVRLRCRWCLNLVHFCSFRPMHCGLSRCR